MIGHKSSYLTPYFDKIRQVLPTDPPLAAQLMGNQFPGLYPSSYGLLGDPQFMGGLFNGQQLAHGLLQRGHLNGPHVQTTPSKSYRRLHSWKKRRRSPLKGQGLAKLRQAQKLGRPRSLSPVLQVQMPGLSLASRPMPSPAPQSVTAGYSNVPAPPSGPVRLPGLLSSGSLLQPSKPQKDSPGDVSDLGA